ncbi:MAG TPA: T9SS type A sorting domain-containing protein, partial [Ignavibacteria bacterium]|nr:T9SS type A sorting domain-containing protein [Ignavibacteria bacterium]
NIFIKTTDGGNHWNNQFDVPASFNSIFFVSPNSGWGVGYGGMIAKFNQTLVNVTEVNHRLQGGYSLSQNYPNPFNPVTNLEFRIDDLGYVSLKVYNVLGNEIRTLVNEIKLAGSYKVEFDATSLASGIYFYSLLINGNLTDTKRMILLK